MALTAWIAEQSGLTVFHMDPMKMQVAELADVMSYQFAKRHDLLCVKITPMNSPWRWPAVCDRLGGAADADQPAPHPPRGGPTQRY